MIYLIVDYCIIFVWVPITSEDSSLMGNCQETKDTQRLITLLKIT